MTSYHGSAIRGDSVIQKRLGQLIVAAALMGATGITLVVAAIWAFKFQGFESRDLRRALDGNSMTTAGVVLLIGGIVFIACAVGAMVGPKVNRWVGLVSRLVGILVGAVAAISGIWFVVDFPGWAITFTVVGAVVVYVLTLYERELESSWPWTPLRAHVAKVLALNTKGINVPRGAVIAGLLLITLVVTTAQHQERYFLSVAFGLLFVGLSDPGGAYLSRFRRMAVVGLIGTLLTALGFGIGGVAWGYVVLATFVITVVGGLVINFGVEALVAGILLNVWFLIALSAATGLPARVSFHPWNQALAWLIGSGIWIVFTFILWLARGRPSRPSVLPEIPSDLPPIKLSRPIVTFVLIRAFAVSAAIAIAFGLQLSTRIGCPSPP